MRMVGMWMSKKIRTKISLITMYGFILFYVRVKQISVASGTVMANEWIRLERLPRDKKMVSPKMHRHIEVARERLAWLVLCNFAIQNDTFLLHYIFLSCILIFYWALCFFFHSPTKSCWLCDCVCVCMSLRLCSKVNVLLFRRAVATLLQTNNQIYVEIKANKTSLIESEIFPKRVKHNAIGVEGKK